MSHDEVLAGTTETNEQEATGSMVEGFEETDGKRVVVDLTQPPSSQYVSYHGIVEGLIIVIVRQFLTCFGCYLSLNHLFCFFKKLN